MTVIAMALGLFYVIASLLAAFAVRREWFLDHALEELTMERGPERGRLYFMTISTGLYGAAGIALLLRSELAVWLLGSGLLLQGGYYGMVWRQIIQDELDDRERWQKALNAGILSTAAFAFSAYAARQGVLT